jgi:hypothetical protein
MERALRLPEVQDGTSYGTPALKVRGKLFVRLPAADTAQLGVLIEDAWRRVAPKRLLATLDAATGSDEAVSSWAARSAVRDERGRARRTLMAHGELHLAKARRCGILYGVLAVFLK